MRSNDNCKRLQQWWFYLDYFNFHMKQRRHFIKQWWRIKDGFSSLLNGFCNCLTQVTITKVIGQFECNRQTVWPLTFELFWSVIMLLCMICACLFHLFVFFKQLDTWEKLKRKWKERSGKVPSGVSWHSIFHFKPNHKLASLRELQLFCHCLFKVKSCACSDPYSACKEGFHMMRKSYLSETV